MVAVDGGWGTWSNWSVCYHLDSSKCGKGLTVRTRACDNPYPQYGGDSCVGKRLEIDQCLKSCKYNCIASYANVIVHSQISTSLSCLKQQSRALGLCSVKQGLSD